MDFKSFVKEDRRLPEEAAASWAALGVQPAGRAASPVRCASGIDALDAFFEGGLPFGAVTEWGVPLGRGGRDVLLSWLGRLTSDGGGGEGASSHRGFALWVNSRSHLSVYPPAWMARGVALERMRFAYSAQPLTDLRPVFMEPLFRVIVLDAPRSFTDEDCAFVARQARANNQMVCLLRDFFLHTGRGSVWAKLRVNCWRDEHAHEFKLEVLRGLSPRKLSLSERDVQRPPFPRTPARVRLNAM